MTASAALDHRPDLATKVYPNLSALPLPQTNGQVLRNFGGEVCGGMLADLFRVSCNTGFAAIGLDLGGPTLASEAQAFGFDKTPPLDLPGAGPGLLPGGRLLRPGPARPGQVGHRPAGRPGPAAGDGPGRLGHRQRRGHHEAARAEGGDQLPGPGHPHRRSPPPWITATSPQTAAQMTQLMISVVNNGTGTAAKTAGRPGGGQDRDRPDRPEHHPRLVRRLRPGRQTQRWRWPSSSRTSRRATRPRAGPSPPRSPRPSSKPPWLARRLRSAMTQQGSSPPPRSSTTATSSSATSPVAGWLRSTWPGTCCSTGPVALKVLFPELSVDHSFVERFRREAQAAANLSHPNIVSVYDWGEGERTYFIVMEYVDGQTLAQMIRKGPLDPSQPRPPLTLRPPKCPARSRARRTPPACARDTRPRFQTLDAVWMVLLVLALCGYRLCRQQQRDAYDSGRDRPGRADLSARLAGVGAAWRDHRRAASGDLRHVAAASPVSSSSALFALVTVAALFAFVAGLPWRRWRWPLSPSGCSRKASCWV